MPEHHSAATTRRRSLGGAKRRENTLRLKRAYEKPSPEDGQRVLVERLWPRGLTKERAAVDLWLKDIAPSAELRKWFGHDPDKWPQFEQRYWKELKDHEDAVDRLRQEARRNTVTLVYAAKDEQHNSAVALKEFVEMSSQRTNLWV